MHVFIGFSNILDSLRATVIGLSNVLNSLCVTFIFFSNVFGSLYDAFIGIFNRDRAVWDCVQEHDWHYVYEHHLILLQPVAPGGHKPASAC